MVTIPPIYRVPPTPYFNGSSSLVQVDNDPSLNIADNLTIHLKVMPKAFSVYDPLISKYGEHQLEIYSDKLRFVAVLDIGTKIWSPPHTFEINKWYDITFTFKNGLGSVYVNGSLIQGFNYGASQIITTTNEIWIGASHWGGWSGYCSCNIGLVLMYSRVLSQTDILQIINNPYSPIKEDLVLWFDNRSFTQFKWIDLSGNENHGTPNNVILRHVRKYPATFVTP